MNFLNNSLGEGGAGGGTGAGFTAETSSEPGLGLQDEVGEILHE